ncbi:hypothetical protein [Microvirga rosea]|uniref:hypothetical protein n=1 Tax=Microvirga rosea TaxID=2715425 RepID=UPI001D0BD98F|nr:hypothetical protein [Microvirga rosea]MCB8820951.1 hypothetical protein [Microvirga rosea]
MMRASVLAGIIALPVLMTSQAVAQTVPPESTVRVLNRTQALQPSAPSKAGIGDAVGTAAWARSSSKAHRYAPRVRGRAARSNDNG